MTRSHGWIVLVGEGAFLRCYGVFPTYDACLRWVVDNGWHPSEIAMYPVYAPREEADRVDA